MWIRSQDRQRLVFCQLISIQYVEEGKSYVYGSIDTTEGNKVLLGVYKAEQAEQAGKVLDSIQAAIRGSREVYEMPS